MRKAIRRSGGKKEYWAIRQFLPRETRSYVPAFIAVNYAFQYAADYGLKAEPPLFSYHQSTPFFDAPVYFNQIAALLATDVRILQKLNPQYIMDYVPAAADASAMRTLVLPANKVGLFISYRDSIRKLIALEAERKEKLGRAAEPVVEHITHRVRSGESLGLIAQRYGVRVSQLKDWNNLSGHLIRTGQKLIIYSSVDHGSRKKETAVKTVTSDADTDVYIVRSGDTLYGIARRYPGISPEQIMAWNHIRSARKIKPGMKLRIHKRADGPMRCSAFLSLLLLLSCTGPSEKVEILLPGSTGGSLEVLVVMDQSLWESSVGAKVREQFNAPMPGMPQEEAWYKLIRIDPKALKELLKRAHLIFMAEIDSSMQSSQGENLWSQPQMSPSYKAPSDAGL